MPSRAVGIDLGTTRAVVARIDNLGRSAAIRDSRGDLLIPSIVFFEDQEVLYGRMAELAAANEPARAAEFYKRDLGQLAYSRAIGGELLPAELVEACLLKKLTGDLAVQGLPNPAVVLSIPASFNQAQRRARLDAAALAGVEVLGTIHDPLAAALAHAESLGYLNPSEADKPGIRVLVFDFGGGKLDVAIVELKPGRLRVMAIDGHPQLGGRDFDLRLAEYLAGEFEKQFHQDPRYDVASVRRLVESAKDAKHALTARQQARVEVRRSHDALPVTIARHKFDELTEDLLDEAMDLTSAVLARSGMAWRDVTQLLLIGGATRMPGVARRLKDLTGLDPATGVQADEYVARGAALLAESLLAAREKRQPAQSFSTVELTVHTLGFEWHDAQTGRLENVVLIRRGSELPCGTVAKVTTETDNQKVLVLKLLEGESRLADECTHIALLTIGDLPDGLPSGAQVDVSYQFTAAGRLQVKAQLARSQQPLSVSLRRAAGLTESQMADWKKLLARPVGLKAIQALLPQHRQQREALDATMPTANTGAPLAPASAPPPLAMQGAAPEEFALDTAGAADPAAVRRRRRRLTPRKVAILLGGYVVSALLGTAIGYYILMWLDPSWNWWRLRLPGIESPP